MTTNQTIDGVPRELLVRLCNFHATGWEDIEPEIKELRALLDAPAVELRDKCDKCGSENVNVQMGGSNKPERWKK